MELRRRRSQEVVFLEHAVASEMASDLATFLGLAGAGAVGGVRGDQVIRRMRRGDEFTFRDLRIRLTRIEEGDENDRNDDQVELTIITSTQSNQITLTELETTFFENYEITAEEVQPSGGGRREGATNRGEGSARILIRFIEPDTPSRSTSCPLRISNASASGSRRVKDSRMSNIWAVLMKKG